METNRNNTTAMKSTVHLIANHDDDGRPDDAIWILTSAFIIFTMQSGFGLLESGLASRKNEVNIMMKNAIDVISGGLAYWIFGFAFSFGNHAGTNAFCGVGYFFTDTDEKTMGYVYSKYFFQLSFATTATTIVSGAMAERTNLKAYIAFSFFNTLTYCFPAHWIWADNGWLKKLGAIDIAGGSAVHIVGGVSGLVATIYLKPRTGYFKIQYQEKQLHSMACPTNVLLGTFMLWWGWLGFNCGSTFGISGEKWKLVARSAICTINASIGGGISGMIFSYVFYKDKLDIAVFVTGLLGGLVGITGICAVTRPSYALIIGIIGGLIACSGCKLLKRLQIDDPVGCVPVHFFSGVWSLIAVAFFLEKDHSGYFSSEAGILGGGRWYLLGVQIGLAASASLWSSCVTLILLAGINMAIPIRLSFEKEMKGADETEHGISCPNLDEPMSGSTYGSPKVHNNKNEAEGVNMAGALVGNNELTNDQETEISDVENPASNESLHSASSSKFKKRNVFYVVVGDHEDKQNDGFLNEFGNISDVTERLA